MLEKLIETNNYIITQTTDSEKKKKHQLIKKILEDKQCFLKIDIETSYAILRELNVDEENLRSVYLSLIDPVNNSL